MKIGLGYRFVLVFLLSISLTTNVFAQKIEKEVVDKLVNYLACNLAKESITSSNKKWSCDCEDYSSLEMKNIRKAIGSNSKTVLLVEEIELLKKDKNVLSKDEAEIVKYLAYDVFAEDKKYAKIYTFASKRSKDKMDAIQATLNEGMKKIVLLPAEVFNQASQATVGAVEISNEETQSNEDVNAAQEVSSELDVTVTDDGTYKDILTETETDQYRTVSVKTVKGPWYSMRFNILSIGFTVLINILLYLFFNGRINWLKRRVLSLEEEVNSYKSSEGNSNTVSSTFEKVTNNKIEKLEEVCIGLLSKIETLSKQQVAAKEQVSSSTNQQSIMYMPAPENGVFSSVKAKKTYEEGVTLYQFKQRSEREAFFQIDNSPIVMKIALSDIGNIIESVCETENQYEEGMSSVETITLGLAELRQDKWVVIRKSKVRFK